MASLRACVGMSPAESVDALRRQRRRQRSQQSPSTSPSEADQQTQLPKRRQRGGTNSSSADVPNGRGRGSRGTSSSSSSGGRGRSKEGTPPLPDDDSTDVATGDEAVKSPANVEAPNKEEQQHQKKGTLGHGERRRDGSPDPTIALHGGGYIEL